jgi:hypothetical protein
MATTYYNDIQKLYVAYFNRPADAGGLAYYEGVLEAAKGSATVMAQISADFAKSAEYTAAFNGMSNADIVNTIYMNIFGHAADDAGKKFYADALDAKQVTVANVVQEVAKGAQGTDLVAYNSKLTAAAAFSAAVDTDAEKAGYSGDAANKVAKAFLASVTDSLSLATATTPAALNAKVGDVVAAGTAFTVATAMSNLGTANSALKSFLVTADGDTSATTSATPATIATALTTAQGDVVTDLGANGATYTAGSASVKAAIINDQIVANAAALSTAQAHVATAQAAINAVTGLSAAVSALAAANDAATAADKTELAAAADLNAKLASYNTLNSAAVTVAADGTVTGLITKDSSTGALKLATGVTEATKAGVTALLAASAAKEAADAAQTNAHTVADAAQLQVNHLDVSPANTNAEATTLATVTGYINTYGDITLAAGAKATEAQISNELSILTAKDVAAGGAGAAHTNLTDFTAAVTAYHAAAVANPLVDALTAANTEVETAGDVITTFSEDLATLKVAQSNADQLAGYNAQVAAAQQLFTAHNFNLVNNVSGTVVGSGASDVFVVGTADATINLFGLQGADSLYIGTGYTANTAGLTKGNDAVLEAFIVAANSGADTKIVLETKVFGSNSTDAEITITLTGVKAADVHLDANGIITVGTPTA